MAATIPTQFRLPPGFLRDLDRYAKRRTRETGIKWTRTDALKVLVKLALDQEDLNDPHVRAQRST